MFRVLETEEGLVQVKVDEVGNILWSRLSNEDKSSCIFSESKFSKIDSQDILYACVKRREHETSGRPASRLRTHSLTLQHTLRRSSHRLRVKTQEFFGSHRECQELAQGIQRTRGQAGWGPRRLLILINPASGCGHGEQVYRRRVEPILRACDVTTDVFISSSEGEASKLLQNCKLEDIDGVIVVGGDGFANECIHGLVLRALADANKDARDLDLHLLPPPVAIGIIPAGTGNWLAEQVYLSQDPITATIHILRGSVVHASAVSLHVPGQLVRVANLVLHFGLIGDLMHYCQQSRWMGSARYSVLPPAALLKRRTASVAMDMYLADNSDDDDDDLIQSFPMKQHFAWEDQDGRADRVSNQVYNIGVHVNRVLTPDGVLRSSLRPPHHGHPGDRQVHAWRAGQASD
ncbi:ceramide kinase-like [Pomacea canaliculata]|uniref:ceramide kinase-like n=1 Tax=Pomacea canaliculata TaxID=400727 RepID=UPI000D725737|nr:ceramide kinase-like [Pomacea canaliculata]